MIKNILLGISVLFCLAVPISVSAQCGLDAMGGGAASRQFSCTGDGTYSITFSLLVADATIEYASVGTINGNTVSGIPSGQAVQVTIGRPGCNSQTRWIRWCCGPSNCLPENIWVATGSPSSNGSSGYYDMMFENEVTGEVRHAFCTEIDMYGPGEGSRYCLQEDGLTLYPLNNICSNQIMYIFGSKCDYEKPVLGGIPEECADNYNSLTASCVQGTPMWYKKDAIGLTLLGSGNNVPAGLSGLRNYLRCENADKSCFSEFVTVNIRTAPDANPQPSPEKSEICVGETIDLSFNEGCNSYAGYIDKWYQGSTPLTSSLVSPTTTTTYTLRCINVQGCDVTINAAETVITVNTNCAVKVFDLALRKTMAPDSKAIYKVGDEVTFNITVFNQGNVEATSVDLVDYIPTGLTLKTGSNWTLDGDKARWIGAITNLSPESQEVVTITFVVNSSATGVIINTAEISGATNPENLEDIDSTPDDDKDNDDPVKNDEINEDGKNNPDDDEDDHDIEPITICTEGNCIPARVNKKN